MHTNVVCRFLPCCWLGVLIFSAACRNDPAAFQKELQEKFIAAKRGTVIEIPEGKFHFDRTLSLTVDGVTIRGKGMNKTILSFTGQKAGAQGVLIKANDFVIEDVGIEDSAGDALTIQGGNNITVRRVRAEWTRGPNENNGPYAIYPVECKNLLVEDSVAKGAADAGIYVGQSENVVLRRNRAEGNVDGYEIENTENLDAYDNVSTHNSGGMGVFNLPNLPRQGGKHIRLYNNQVVDNNAKLCPQKPGTDLLSAGGYGRICDGHSRRRGVREQDSGQQHGEFVRDQLQDRRGGRHRGNLVLVADHAANFCARR
jgi:parallel beta-helix repeat protein